MTDKPIQPRLIARLIAGIYVEIPLPADLSGPDGLERFASEFARHRGVHVCLKLNPGHPTWIDKHGHVALRDDSAGTALGYE